MTIPLSPIPKCLSSFRQRHQLVGDQWRRKAWSLHFDPENPPPRRGPENLILFLQHVRVGTHSGDHMVWCLDPKRQFSVRSLYKFLNFGGIKSCPFKVIWASKVPMKVINIIMLYWLEITYSSVNGRILSNACFALRTWRRYTTCCSPDLQTDLGSNWNGFLHNRFSFV